MLAAVLLTFGRFLAIRFYHSPALVQYLPLFALMMLFSVLTTFYGKVLAGYHDIKLRTLIVNFVGSPLNMLMAVVLIAAGMGLRGYLWAQILSGALVCLLLLIAVRQFTPAAARFFRAIRFVSRKSGVVFLRGHVGHWLSRIRHDAGR